MGIIYCHFSSIWGKLRLKYVRFIIGVKLEDIGESSHEIGPIFDEINKKMNSSKDYYNKKRVTHGKCEDNFRKINVLRLIDRQPHQKCAKIGDCLFSSGTSNNSLPFIQFN